MPWPTPLPVRWRKNDIHLGLSRRGFGGLVASDKSNYEKTPVRRIAGIRH